MNEDEWQETQDKIANFRRRISSLSAEDRTPEALAEIAIQLIWINTSLDRVEEAIHRVADRG